MRDRVRVSGLAIVSSLVFFFIASALGADLLVTTGGSETEPMSWLNVVIFTAVASGLAIGLAALLDRFGSGRTIWMVVGGLILVSSMFTIPRSDLSTADFIWQALLHAVYGLLMMAGFYFGWPSGQDD